VNVVTVVPVVSVSPVTCEKSISESIDDVGDKSVTELLPDDNCSNGQPVITRSRNGQPVITILRTAV
jgi:hypothetical protein